MYTVSTPIKATTANPGAASVSVKVKTEVTGIDYDEDTDVVTLDGDLKALLGDTLTKYVEGTGDKGKQNVYFAPKDQYGKNGGNMAQYYVTESYFANDAAKITVDSKGRITYGTVAPSAGDYIIVSGTTTTSLVESIKIEFGNVTLGTDNAAVIAAKLQAATTAVEAYEALPLTTQDEIDDAKASDLGDKATAAIAEATAAGATAAQTDPLTARVAAKTTAIDNAVAGAVELTGVYSSMLGVNMLKVTLPVAGQAVTSLKVDGVEKTAGTHYSVDGVTVNVLDVTAANAVIIVTADGITYVVK